MLAPLNAATLNCNCSKLIGGSASAESKRFRKSATTQPSIRHHHAFFLELFDGVGGFVDGRYTHAFEDLGRLGELAIVVGHDLDAVAPGIENVHTVVDAFYAAPRHRLAHRFAIVDDQTEVALGVRRLRPAEGELDKLIAEIDKDIMIAFAAQLELE